MFVYRIIFLLYLSIFEYVYSYSSYRDRIPNGFSVRHPCTNSNWPGVGHVQQGGGGRRNKFGQDFARYREWSRICRLDSDGDGRTNGEELGDPACIWYPGTPPPTPVGPITHPGICDQVTGGICPGLTMDGCPSQSAVSVQQNPLLQQTRFVAQNQQIPGQGSPQNQFSAQTNQRILPIPNGQAWQSRLGNPMNRQTQAAAQMPTQMPPQMQPQTPQQMAPQMPRQMVPQMPPQMPPQTPQQMAPQMPQQMVPQMPPQMPPSQVSQFGANQPNQQQNQGFPPNQMNPQAQGFPGNPGFQPNPAPNFQQIPNPNPGQNFQQIPDPNAGQNVQQSFPGQSFPFPETYCGDLSSPDTQPFPVRLPTLQVPSNQEVTYACVVVDVPLDKEYHVIASSPLIENMAVVHSMNVYGCKRGMETTEVPIANSPFKCSLQPIDGCSEFITGYSPSKQDVCFHRGTGVRLGRMGFRKVMLQVLWSNPSRLTGQTDRSGMNLYLTTRLRQNNIGTATLRVAQFSLPPWQPMYEIKATCAPDCTSVQIKKQVYITAGINYMNMLGRDQKIEVIRNGNIVALVSNDQNVNYPHPRLFWLRRPVEVLPGDELRVTCSYNTYSVNRTITSGNAPTDEVCSAEISYYPSENWNNPECENFISLPLCKIKSVGIINGCTFSRFLSSLPKEPTVDAIITECNQSCSQNCSGLVEIMKRHSCFQGDLLNLWESNLRALKNNRLNIVFWAIRNCENLLRNTIPVIPSGSG